MAASRSAALRADTRISLYLDVLGQHADGVHDLETDGDRVQFEVDTAQTDAALGVLVRSGVRTLTAQPPTLEDLFLRHYGDTTDA